MRTMLLFCFVLAACGSPAVVAPTATPRPVPTATPIDLAALLLPLPTTEESAPDTTTGLFADLPRPQKEAGRGFKGGFVAAFVYDSPADQAMAYATLANGMSKGKDDRTLGEQARVVIIVTNASGDRGGDTLFQRCTAIVYIRGTGLKDPEVMSTYAHALDKRLEAAVC